MSTLSCAFAVRHRRARGRDELARRIAALERFYAPVGLGGAAFEHRDAISVTIGAIGAAPLASRALFWGAPFGSRPPEANAVLEAGDERLRGDAVGIGLAIAWTDQAARIVTAPAGPTAGYAAESEDFAVWASHAVAAAWLAHGHATVDREAIPELLAFDFVGDGRSLVAGAQPMALATCVDIDAGAAATRSWWPAAERWAPVAESEASAHVERELLRSLERRTAGLGRVGLCLTGGADSRVLAVGLCELGVAASAVTWGEPGWEDVVAAAAVADALGIDWQQRAAWREDAEIAVRADAEARWSDGAFGVAPADRLWPAGTAAVMVGAAGEVGRAFYYRRLADRDPPADAEAVADSLFPEGRIAGAAEDACAAARVAARRWAHAALESGRTGWSALDVLYAEQRVGHWGRGQVPALEADFLAGFASAEIVRGLASLPPADRLADGFHRRFVASRRPDLALPEPPAPAPLPRPRGRLARLAGRARRPGPPPRDEFLVDLWAARPAARTHIAEAVLGSSLIAEVMGAAWCDTVRAGFLGGDPRAAAHALTAGGAVALADALRDLQLPEVSMAERTPTARPPR